MGNCLISKLKAVVENDTLPKIGDLILKLQTTDDAQNLTLRAKTSNKCYMTADVSDYKNVAIPTTNTVYTFTVASGLNTVKISNKYDIETFISGACLSSFNINDFNGNTVIRTIRIYGITAEKTGVIGNVRELLNSMVKEGRTLSLALVADSIFTDIPVGVGNNYNKESIVTFSPNYPDGWYVTDKNGVSYNSRGEIITP